jgi:hypothetical protein
MTKSPVYEIPYELNRLEALNAYYEHHGFEGTLDDGARESMAKLIASLKAFAATPML